MATNFTNKYMQVFQNYNEFSEHSADYVRGEDHIAFLIEENEVIYWLYLEQVWRPLNVRTTTTGELEDGRTKVAVRLEYVKGGQKYTSVPNIPDPERITSMSHFLEDYPDIEEVNVAGTVNLTDLSYAFAGSKIKDFSMLDTSNVTYFDYIFKDINDETRDLFLKINQSINNIIAGDIVLNNLTIESTNEKVISTVKLGESDIKNSLIIKGNINFELIYDTLTSNKFYRFNNIKSDANINLLSNGQDSYVDYNNIICKELTLGWNTINVLNNGYVFETHCDKIIIENGDNNSYTARDYRKIECYDVKEFILKTSYDNPFSGGIKFNNNDDVKITISDVINIGNFWFTTPIVDDAFYAKYAQYNIPISIFQYKTIFEEVADVNISSEVDSSLIYVDWTSINFDTSGMSVEIYNAVNCNLYTIHSNNYNVFKKLIIDNSNINLGDDVDNYPSISTLNGSYSINDNISNIDFDNYRISGKYKNTASAIINDSRFKDIIIYCNNKQYKTTIDAELDFNVDRNIKIYDYSNIELYVNKVNKQNTNYRIDSLIENNELNISFIPTSNNCGSDFKFYINYVENVKLTIKANSVLIIYRNWLEHSTADNPVIVNGILQNTFSITTNFNYDTIPLESCYMNFSDNGYIQYVDGGKANKNFDAVVSKNFYGIINIKLSSYIPGANYTDCGIKHIDLNKVLTGSGSAGDNILRYQSCDDETTINLITKLVDNTSSTIKTIYMYRSQSNIIGEDNIAAAVAKNYEFAIIEN